MGVWIETYHKDKYSISMWSHPTWVCGLKQTYGGSVVVPDTVTPYVGVWIETKAVSEMYSQFKVTPYVGVWIETS